MNKAAKREIQDLCGLALCAVVITMGLLWFFWSDVWPIGLAFVLMSTAVLLRSGHENDVDDGER